MEAALATAAVDFFDKPGRWPILVRRIELITEAARAGAEGPALELPQVMRLEPPKLRFDINRPGRLLSDLVHGKDIAAGYGPDGYRVDVRSFIKRIRKKFREVPLLQPNPELSQVWHRWVSE